MKLSKDSEDCVYVWAHQKLCWAYKSYGTLSRTDTQNLIFVYSILVFCKFCCAQAGLFSWRIILNIATDKSGYQVNIFFYP